PCSRPSERGRRADHDYHRQRQHQGATSALGVRWVSDPHLTPSCVRRDRQYTIHSVNEDKASRYQRLKRTAEIIALVWSVTLLIGFLWSGASIGLRQLAEAPIPSGAAHPALVVLTYVVLLLIVNEVVSVPLSFYGGFLIERRYGLSNQTL